MTIQLILFSFGILVLYFSAKIVVNSAVKIAQLLQVRKFIIGITVVSFASSLPEFFISGTGLFHNHPEIMIGNVIGSSIANLGLILPCALLINPVVHTQNILNRDVVVFFCALTLFVLFLKNGILGHIEGAILFAALICYNLSLIHSSRLHKSNSNSHLKTAKLFLKSSLYQWHHFAFLIAGIISLIFSARIIVNSAVQIAILLKVSELAISLSLVAFATALPELGMSIISAIKKQNELLIGNIIGSNIYNLLFVSGFNTLIMPAILKMTISLSIQIFFLIGFSVMSIMHVKREKSSRITAGLVLMGYLLYISLLFAL